MKTVVWDQSIHIIDTINISCAKALSQTLNGAAAVTADGGNQTKITITGHGYAAGSYVYLTGTVNYDGLQYIYAKGTNDITIQSPFVAETFAGTETTRFAYKAPVACEIAELRIHQSAAPTTSEDFVVTVDSARGSAYDTVVFTKALGGYADYIWTPGEIVTFNIDDILVCTYTNTDTKTLGIELKVRRIAKPGIVRN